MCVLNTCMGEANHTWILLQVVGCKWTYVSAFPEVNIQFDGIALELWREEFECGMADRFVETTFFCDMPEYTHNWRQKSYS